MAGDKSQKGAGKQEKVTIQKQPDVLYSRSELIEAASSFGVKPETMAGAIKLAGKNEMAKIEAQAAVKKYLERTV